MIRLYNHTRYQDEILRTVLTFAARCAGVKGDVPVKITPSHYPTAWCYAHRSWPYRKTLIGRPTTSVDKRILKCPVGWVEMHLPRHIVQPLRPGEVRIPEPDPIQLSHNAAEWFMDTSIHEMAHIRQFRTGLFSIPKFDGRAAWRKRRQNHDDRPCEIDAENTVYDVKHNRSQNKRREFLIEQLALSMLDTLKPTSPSA